MYSYRTKITLFGFAISSHDDFGGDLLSQVAEELGRPCSHIFHESTLRHNFGFLFQVVQHRGTLGLADERKYDVDFGAPKDEFYQLTLTLPEGYKVDETPKPARIQMPEGTMKYEYLISVKDNILSLNTKFNIKKTSYNPEEYAILKQFYAQILAKMGEQIVLTKAAK